VTLDVAGNGMNYVLTFGGHPLATDGLDGSYDVPSPPLPPNPVYSAHFSIAHAIFNRLTKDVRGWVAPYQTAKVWTLKVVNADGITSHISWDPATLPAIGDFILNASIHMRTQGSADFTGNQTLTLEYRASAPVTYSVTLRTDPGGAGTVAKSPDKTAYSYGETVSLSASSASGYAFERWSGSASGMANPVQLVMDQDKDVTANFGHTLTVQSGPANGGTTVKNPDKSVYAYNESIILNAYPSAGFVFMNWSGSASGTNPQMNLTMSQNHSITAGFGHTLTISIRDGYGNITQYGSVVRNPMKSVYAHNELIMLSAVASTGWTFVRWEGDGAGTQPELDVTVGKNKSIIAVFEEINQPVTVELLSAPSGRTILVDGVPYATPMGFLWAKNSSHTIGADAYQVLPEGHTRYRFTRWSDGKEQTHAINTSQSSSFTAFFDLEYELKLISDYGSPIGGGWYTGNSQVTIRIVREIKIGITEKQIFVQWTGNGNGSYTGKDTSQTILINNPVNETVVWQTTYFLATGCNPAEGGGVTPQAPGGWVDKGANVSIEASAKTDLNYTFGGWTGDLSGTANPAWFSMDKPKQITANFIRQGDFVVTTKPSGLKFRVDGVEYTSLSSFRWTEGSAHLIEADSGQSGAEDVRYNFLRWNDGGLLSHAVIAGSSGAAYTAEHVTQYYLSTYEHPSTGGKITPALPGIWVNSGESVSVSAVANSQAGYMFAGWSGSMDGNANPGSVVLTGPKRITANFIKRGGVVISTVPNGLLFQADGTTYTAPQAFSWEPGIFHTLSIPSPQTSGEKIRYTFDSWSDGGAAFHSIRVADETADYTGFFKTQYFLTTSAVPVQGGTVLPLEPGQWFDRGEKATLRAVAFHDLGYFFNGWNGDFTENQNPGLVIMDGPKSVSAFFQMANHFVVTESEPSEGGIVRRNPEKSIFAAGEALQLQAYPNSGFQFEKWIGDFSSTANPSAVSVNGHMKITAKFSQANIKELVRIPDIHMLEDQSWTFDKTDMKSFLLTSNISLDQCCFRLCALPENISWNWDDKAKKMTVIPFPNWNGTDQIRIEMFNSEGVVSRDTIRVTVLPLDDPPAPFSLVYPVDSTQFILPTQMVQFCWFRSQNWDEKNGDKIKYKVYIGKPNRLYPVVTSIPDTVLNLVSLANLNLSPGTYAWVVEAADLQGYSIWSNTGYFTIGSPSDVKKEIVSDIRLSCNYPNPFNTQTRFQYYLPHQMHVRISVYDALGVRIRMLCDQIETEGRHQAVWDGEDESAMVASNGIYVVYFQMDSNVFFRKAVLLK
jgi:hypothetical protein